MEEAYVEFSDVVSLLTMEESAYGLSAIVGKKQLGIGKINPLHPEQWDFVDRSVTTQQFFGEDHALAADGLQVMGLLPVSFFSQLELGYWKAEAHSATATHSSVEYENRILTGRLWNSFALSDEQELQVGINYLLGNASGDTDDQQEVMVYDVTYSQDLGKNQSYTLLAEIYDAKYGDHGQPREKQNGYFVSGVYQFDAYYDAGVRYAHLGTHGTGGNELSQYSFMLTRQLTDTSKFRVQYNTGTNVEDTILAQFIFGMGPHSHVLQ